MILMALAGIEQRKARCRNNLQIDSVMAFASVDTGLKDIEEDIDIDYPLPVAGMSLKNSSDTRHVGKCRERILWMNSCVDVQEYTPIRSSQTRKTSPD